MCGKATFAIEVSSTSMNVANVTVTAITQGLMVPSGVRSLDKIPFMILVLETPLLSVLRSGRAVYSALLRDHRRVHIHSRA